VDGTPTIRSADSDVLGFLSRRSQEEKKMAQLGVEPSTYDYRPIVPGEDGVIVDPLGDVLM
jgi:hypothetical protein